MGAGQSHAGIEALPPQDVGHVLVMNGFDDAAAIFEEAGITGKDLMRLTAAKVRSMFMAEEQTVDERALERMFDVRTKLLKHERTMTREQIIKWTPEQVAAMLRLNHLGRYSPKVLRDEINGGLLVQLKESIGQQGELMHDELDIVRLQSVLTYYVTVT